MIYQNLDKGLFVAILAFCQVICNLFNFFGMMGGPDYLTHYLLCLTNGYDPR